MLKSKPLMAKRSILSTDSAAIFTSKKTIYHYELNDALQRYVFILRCYLQISWYASSVGVKSW
jgi:hypothetical protein